MERLLRGRRVSARARVCVGVGVCSCGWGGFRACVFWRGGAGSSVPNLEPWRELLVCLQSWCASQLRFTYPIPLAVHQGARLLEDLLVGLGLGDAGRKGGRLGVDLAGVNRQWRNWAGAWSLTIVAALDCGYCGFELLLLLQCGCFVNRKDGVISQTPALAANTGRHWT